MSIPTRLLFLLPPLVGLTMGCAEYELSKASLDTGGAAADLDTGEYDDSDTGGSSPRYWSADGLLVLAEGAVVPEESTVALALWSSSEEICSLDLPITAASAEEAPEDVALYGWWTMSLGSTGATCRQAVPELLRLGVGALDPRLYPAMDTHGYATEESTLYGLYLQQGDEAPVYVYGVAGTDENFAGETAPVTAAPLPDGTYMLVGLHLLPLAQ